MVLLAGCCWYLGVDVVDVCLKVTLHTLGTLLLGVDVLLKRLLCLLCAGLLVGNLSVEYRVGLLTSLCLCVDIAL